MLGPGPEKYKQAEEQTMWDGGKHCQGWRVGLLGVVQSQSLGLNPFICKMDRMLIMPEKDGSGRESVMERGLLAGTGV